MSSQTSYVNAKIPFGNAHGSSVNAKTAALPAIFLCKTPIYIILTASKAVLIIDIYFSSRTEIFYKNVLATDFHGLTRIVF